VVVFSGLLLFGSFSFADLVWLKPSSVLLEEQKNRSEAELGEAKRTRISKKERVP